MKTKIFVFSFFAITMLIGVSCKVKTKDDKQQTNATTAETSKKDSIPKGEWNNPEEDTITGYFNRDRILDTAYLIPNPVSDSCNCTWAIDAYFENECDTIVDWTKCQYCTIRFSDSTIPSIRVVGISGALHNVGDLNNNGTDELLFYPYWFQSNWGYYYVWTLSNSKWINAVEPVVFVHMIDDGSSDDGGSIKDWIKRHPRKKGYVVIEYTDWEDEPGWVVKTKTVKIKR